MMILSGSSNQPLAAQVAKLLEVRLGEVELSRFANNEARVWIKEPQLDKEVVIVQSLSQPTDHNLIEFSLICDAAKRMGAKEITAVIPWLGYSKQDKVFRRGEPLSVKVIAKILQLSAVSKIITFDLHNLAILGFFEIPVVNITAKPLFLDYFKDQPADALVVAPDAGSVKASTAFAFDLGLEVAYIDKKRDLVSGEVQIVGINKDVTGRKIIIVDDLVVTGSTLIEVSAFLHERGATSIEVAATHHLYVPGVAQKIDESMIDSLAVTDTVLAKEASSKTRVLSVASLIAEELQNN